MEMCRFRKDQTLRLPFGSLIKTSTRTNFPTGRTLMFGCQVRAPEMSISILQPSWIRHTPCEAPNAANLEPHNSERSR